MTTMRDVQAMIDRMSEHHETAADRMVDWECDGISIMGEMASELKYVKEAVGDHDVPVALRHALELQGHLFALIEHINTAIDTEGDE